MNIPAILMATAVLAVLGIAFGGMLTFAAKKFHVDTDTRVEAVRNALPGANCGACGYVGCDAFAAAVVAGEAPPNGCIPGGEASASAIGEILGVEVSAKEQYVSRVLCQGTSGIAKDRYKYDGYRSCRVAASLSGGPKQCRFTCIGLGDCAFSCRFGAITMREGIAYVDEKRCTGCGTCIEVCPRGVLSMLPQSAQVIVRCRNSDVAREARSVCQRACIACGRCVKECEYDAIKVENGFAKIDPEKCTRCGKCVPVCPCKCITISSAAQDLLDLERAMSQAPAAGE